MDVGVAQAARHKTNQHLPNAGLGGIALDNLECFGE
jgi:hypothetical protein